MFCCAVQFAFDKFEHSDCCKQNSCRRSLLLCDADDRFNENILLSVVQPRARVCVSVSCPEGSVWVHSGAAVSAETDH